MKLLSYKKNEGYGLGVSLENMILDLNSLYGSNFGGFHEFSELAQLDMISLLFRGNLGFQLVNKAIREVGKVISEGDENRLLEYGVLRSTEEVEFAAPIPNPRKNIVCLGFNYADHISEGSRREDLELPESPIFFTKAPTSVIGPYDYITYPKATSMLDYEVELAVVIGKRGKYIPEQDAYKWVAGYTVFNDVTARDLQRVHQQWFKGKSLDTFAPMGPYLVTVDEIPDPMNLDLELRVNGETRQRSNTSNMIFDVKRIISTLSQGLTLEVGDIIATGTPSGVGMAHPSGLLKVGDVVETCIEGIGTLRNIVATEE